jgi:membrane associated rhomboid family serine protease
MVCRQVGALRNQLANPSLPAAGGMRGSESLACRFAHTENHVEKPIRRDYASADMLADRPYMRNRSSFSGWWATATSAILIANLAVFIFQQINDVYLRWPLMDYFALSERGLSRGYVWQLITFQFMHGGPLHLLINSFMLYMFGRTVEATLGMSRFLELYFLSGVAGGIFQGALGLILPEVFGKHTVGASAGVSGLLALFCVLNRDQTILLMFVFPIRAWNLLIVLLAMAAFFVVVPSDPGVAHAAHLGGMLAAMGYEKWLLRRERMLFDWRPYASVVRSRQLVRMPARKRAFWKKEPPRVVDDLPPAEFISKEVDPILDKISAHGIHSLTERERRILEAARSKMAKR